MTTRAEEDNLADQQTGSHTDGRKAHHKVAGPEKGSSGHQEWSGDKPRESMNCSKGSGQHFATSLKNAKRLSAVVGVGIFL